MFERLRRRIPPDGLWLSRDGLETLTDGSAFMVGIAVSGILVYVNPETRRVLGGRRPESLVGRSIFDLVHPDDLERERALIAAIESTGTPLPWTTMRLVDLDGRSLEQEVSAAPVHYLGHAAVLFVGRDLGDQRRALDALQQSESRYQTLAAAAPVAIYRLDSEGRFIYMNQRWSELTGIPIDEAMGRNWLELVSPVGKERAIEIWRNVVAGPGEYRGEHELGHRDGTPLQILTHVVSEKDSSGRILGWVGTLIDVTAVKAAELALADSEERLRVAFEAANMASWDVDLESGRVTWSANAPRVLGVAPDQLAPDARALWTLIRPEEVSFRKGSARESFERGEPFEVEARFARRSPVPRWLLIRGQGHEPGGGRGRRVVGVVADVTARRQLAAEHARLEQKLLEAQRLESLGLLAGGVAHDFNNLLVGILGNAELALARTPDGSPVRGLVEEIRSAGMRAAELVNQILAYSGHGPLICVSVDLADLVRETLALLRGLLSAPARIDLEPAADPPVVDGDMTQLRQVLMNLLTNACESLPETGGRVTVRFARLPASLTGDASVPARVALEVADTGCGMSPQTRARIFDPFFTTRASGRGLGLAVVHGIVRAHGGSIEVDSEPGAGTRMRVVLPAGVLPSSRPIEPSPPARVPDARGGLVLVIDDERAVREVARLALESAGHRVLVAGDAAEALRLVSDHAESITAIVLDLTLGPESSESVLAEIRSRALTLPVILTSGYPEEEAVGRLAELGVAAFVQKPFTPARLAEGVARVIAARG
jgi:two-component system cell cycle sensor histidine kinase/response regulator CckA